MLQCSMACQRVFAACFTVGEGQAIGMGWIEATLPARTKMNNQYKCTVSREQAYTNMSQSSTTLKQHVLIQSALKGDVANEIID
jgi:hypothetical protein